MERWYSKQTLLHVKNKTAHRLRVDQRGVTTSICDSANSFFPLTIKTACKSLLDLLDFYGASAINVFLGTLLQFLIVLWTRFCLLLCIIAKIGTLLNTLVFLT